ncbi:SDR family oxidoreductase [Fodinibius sediminis]|uniref:NAD(P)H dehydrogenase (Quinone) n=1 Tax=Fodinibius sediminis TaxID=1214077 RepID=A0A521EPS6_9BACT|nr:SDR family oxidoreductase [Fodinibius sediminis]SMO85917.1 NAD(P)H dehydrogenase (quinone) [Fodinibius sediminis]
MILITGANGHLGSQTIDFLIENNPDADIAGLVRSEKKGAELKEKGVELRIGDYTDYPSIEKAVEGIDTLLLISSSTLKGRIGQHNNVIQAAKEAGAEQIFYTSIVEADKELSPLSPDHAATEKLIKESGIPYTLYRNAFYMEYLPLFLGDALETGRWTFPSGGNPINLALRSEMAEALANGLANAEQHKNSIYEITSDQAYTLDEIAGMLSEVSGTDITYKDTSVSDFEQALTEAGLPEEQVDMSVMTAQTFVNGALDFIFDDMEKLIGRKPTGLDTFIKQFVNQ